jgi:hypothetical protein
VNEQDKYRTIVKELSEILGRDIRHEKQSDTILELIELYKKVKK